jgi:two-component system phosphate regulon response regulator OmpR
MQTVSTKATLLIVDDEVDVREVLEEYFTSHGYTTIGAENAAAAKALAAKHPIDLALVDINMPGEDGLSLARHLRERYKESRHRHADLSGNGRRPDRRARDGRRRLRAEAVRSRASWPPAVKSVLRRTSAGNPAPTSVQEKIRVGPLRARSSASHRLTDETGAEVAMSPLEFDLLKALAEQPNRPLSRERILNLSRSAIGILSTAASIFGDAAAKKIEPDPEHPRYIRTVRNEGYIFVPDGS